MALPPTANPNANDKPWEPSTAFLKWLSGPMNS